MRTDRQDSVATRPRRSTHPPFCALVAIAVVVAPTAAHAQSGDQGSEQRSDLRAATETGLRRAVELRGEQNPRFSIRERMDYYHVPGLSLAVIDDGAIAWMAAYGVGDSTNPWPVSVTTLFQAASISKAVVAVAAMRMRDAELIDLDRDIGVYLEQYVLPPGRQSLDNPVTFRNLLSHTSGITAGGYAGYAPDAPLPTDLQILRGESPANSRAIAVDSPPGTAVAYSGGGYTLIELAMQDISGRPFEDVMSRWVLSPLAMQRSTFQQPLPEALAADAAVGHDSAGARVEGGWRVHPEQAAAGLWTTAHDLATFAAEIARAYRGGSEFLSHSTAIELLTEQLDGEAVGLVLSGEGATFSFNHAGGNIGYRAFMIMHPATGDGAVVLTNSDTGTGVIDEILRSLSVAYDWPDYRPLRIEAVKVSPRRLERLAGRYEFDLGGPHPNVVEILFESKGVEFGIEFPNGDIYPLTAFGPTSFVHVDTGVTVEFEGVRNETLVVYGNRGTRRRP